jgi:hypothetical protein
MLLVNIHVRGGLPNTTYDVYVRCYGLLGTLKTNSWGIGNATFERPAAGLPSIFSIDMHSQPVGLDYSTTGTITLP